MRPTFALKDNKPVHISDVERGLACGCVCSACGYPLQARKGQKVKHYFAHHKGSECSVETVIHHIAKQIIIESGDIYIPAATYTIENIVNHDFPGQIIPLENIRAEKSMGNIRPDIIGYYRGKPLLIEIYVTHKSDDDKIRKIKEKCISAIEINLSNVSYDAGLRELKRLVLYEPTNREWINNERVNAIHNRFLKNLIRKPIFRCTQTTTMGASKLEGSVSRTNSERGKVGYPQQEKVTYYVFDCPLNKRQEIGESFAWFKDCTNCKFRYEYDVPNHSVFCIGSIKDDVE